MSTKTFAAKLGSSLKPDIIIELNTPAGYMQVLEYILQDYSYIHVVQWYFVNILEEDTLLPKFNSTVFYKDKKVAIEHAKEVGIELFKCV